MQSELWPNSRYYVVFSSSNRAIEPLTSRNRDCLLDIAGDGFRYTDEPSTILRLHEAETAK